MHVEQPLHYLFGTILSNLKSVLCDIPNAFDSIVHE